MSLIINTVTFSAYRSMPDNLVLTGPLNGIGFQDQIQMSRIFPKPVKDNDGVGRPRFKRVKTLTLADGTKKDMIIEVSGSVPVGAADADILAVLDDVADALDTQDLKDLFTKLDINA